jgi:hypothetical protein
MSERIVFASAKLTVTHFHCYGQGDISRIVVGAQWKDVEVTPSRGECGDEFPFLDITF